MANQGHDEKMDAQIAQRVQEIAKFEAGDLVTVNPENSDIPYAGKEFEGVPLQVNEPFHTEDDLLRIDQVDNDDLKKSRVVGAEYVENVRYTFHSDYTTIPLTESRLISWEKYNGPVHLRPHGDRYCYVEDGDKCPICRRTAILVEGKKDSHDHSQTRTCAVCGYEKETEPS